MYKNWRIREIINALNECSQGIDRNTLSVVLNIPRSTLFDNLRKLEQEGLVYHKEIKRDKSKPGRPKTIWFSKLINVED